VKCDALVVDTTKSPIQVPQTVYAPNDAPVTVKVRHLIGESCSVNFKTASLAPATNPLAALLVPLITLKVAAPAPLEKIYTAPGLCLFGLGDKPLDSRAKAIDQDIRAADSSLKRAAKTLDGFSENVLFADIRNLSFCLPKSDCSSDDAFTTQQKELERRLVQTQVALDAAVDTMKLAEQQKDRARQEFDEWRKANPTIDTSWQTNVISFFDDCVDGELSRIAMTADDLKKRLASIADGLKALSRTVEDSYALPLYHNSKVTSDVVCSVKDPSQGTDNKSLGSVSPTDPKTAVGSKPPIPIEIDYQSQPILAGSAGIVISTLGQHVVGIQNRNNGSGGFTTFFAATSHSPVQFIPFSLVHLFLYGSRTNSLNLSGGIGINPYNNSTQIEYFVGPSFITHKFYLSAGAHIGRFQDLGGGFTIGDPVPTGWTSNTPVPTTLRYTAHLAFGITYRIP
jgi:hypothetical protein